MRPVYGDDRPDPDLTARARIRDVALRLFAERGFRGASIRDVARDAGVSPGLIQHHFGSKAGLRAACDAHVLETLRWTETQKLERRDYDADLVSSLYQASQPVMRYVARGLADGWPGMAAVFDEATASTERWLCENWPDRYEAGTVRARTHAAVSVGMSLGTLVLHRHLVRWLGVDPLERGHQHVTSAAMMELFDRMSEFMRTGQGVAMRAALAEYERNISSSGEGESDD